MSNELEVKIKDLIPAPELKDSAEYPISQEGVTYKVNQAQIEGKIVNKLDTRFIKSDEKGAANGVSPLDGNKKIPNENLNFGEVKEGDSNVVSGGEIFETIKNYSSGIKIIDLSTEAPSKDGIFQPIETGIYTNFGNLELTQEEKDSSIVYFYLINGVFSKETKSVSTINEVEKDNTNAISSKGVYDWSIRNVDTIEELRTIKGEIGQKINLLGYYTAGDKPNLLYEWEEGVGEDDGGSVIVVGSGYWSACFNGRINSLDYGISEKIQDNSKALNKIFSKISYKTVEINGNIRYSSKLTIQNSNYFSIKIKGSLKDNGKDIIDVNNKLRKNHNGISITNCSNFTIEDTVLDSEIEAPNGYRVSKEDITKIEPSLSLDNCARFKIKNIVCKGHVGGYVSRVDAETNYDIMRGSYIRIYKCKDYKIEDFIIEQGAGGGEFLSMLECYYFNIKGIKHNQGSSNATFWSAGKIIKCENGIIENIEIYSKSTGSLLDISGRNIHVDKGYVDYENGKLVDITYEWGDLNFDNHNIKISNIKTNSILSINSGAANKDLTENIQYYNIETLYYGESPLFDFKSTDNASIKNMNFYNPRHLVSYNNIQQIKNTHKKIVFENCKIMFENYSPIKVNFFEVFGETVFKNGYIGSSSGNVTIRFFDKFADYNSITDLRESKSKIIFKKVTFENCAIALPINTVFEECFFKNVRFFNTSGSRGHLNIEFIRSELHYVNENPVARTADKWFEFENEYPTTIVFNESALEGVIDNTTAVPFFKTMNKNGSKIVLKNRSVMNIIRGGEGRNNLVNINNESHFSMYIMDSEVRNMTISSVTNIGEYNEKKVKIYLSNIISENRLMSIPDGSEAVLNKIEATFLNIDSNYSFLEEVFNNVNNFDKVILNSTIINKAEHNYKGLVKKAKSIDSTPTIEALIQSLKTAGILE